MRNLIIPFLALLLVLSGCESSRKQIVGQWKTEGGSNEVAWEFFENGTLATGGGPGRYSFGDNQRIKIQTASATFVYQLEFHGDRMIWKDPNGSILRLTKIK